MRRSGSIWIATSRALFARVARPPRSAWAIAAVLGMILASGCKSLPDERNANGPRTVTEFMKQERPGNGVLGP